MVVISLGMDETLKFNLLVIVKLVSIGVFLLVTSPIAGHALLGLLTVGLLVRVLQI